VAGEAEAKSRKMTLLRAERLETWWGESMYCYGVSEGVRTLDELDMSRLAMVSTGWNTISSAIPAEPECSQCIIYHT
jgi:hypothetical protein